MSNIYIQEPQTFGKVLLKTTVGDIDVELWTKECPKTCRNFIQLCMEGYYNGTIFHRLVKGFIVQGGDPDGNGRGGESIYGTPFRDEFHSRLRYTRRGLLGMANSGRNDNGSQFFFTLAATPELQNQNTLFAKVTGDTVFNMLKLEEGMVDQDEKPMYPHKIIKAVILNNPFDDIVPRVEAKKQIDEDAGKRKKKEKGVKNFGLLSFGDEAEEEEKEADDFIQKNVAGKSKSTHDVLDDPKLSKETVKVDAEKKRSYTPELEFPSSSNLEETERTRHKIRDKLKRKNKEPSPKKDDSSSDDDLLTLMNREKEEEKQRRTEEIRKEISQLKRTYATEKRAKEKIAEEVETKTVQNELVKEYLSEKEKYAEATKSIPKKGKSRESHTLALLAKFKEKLNSVREASEDTDNKIESTQQIDNDIEGDNWLAHELNFETELPVLAKDASTKGDDWYDVFDPRNPINKRKRNEVMSSSSSSKRRH